MSWTPANTDAGAMEAAAFHCGIRPAGPFPGCGICGFEKAAPGRYRAMADGSSDRPAQIVAQGAGHLSDGGPKPYDTDHPHGALVMCRSLALVPPPADGWRGADDEPVAALTDRVEALMPFRRLLAERL